MEEEEIYTFSGNSIICPYCGHKTMIHSYDYFEDCTELDSEIEVECDECGKTFVARREIEFNYRTFKKEKEEIE